MLRTLLAVAASLTAWTPDVSEPVRAMDAHFAFIVVEYHSGSSAAIRRFVSQVRTFCAPVDRRDPRAMRDLRARAGAEANELERASILPRNTTFRRVVRLIDAGSTYEEAELERRRAFEMWWDALPYASRFPAGGSCALPPFPGEHGARPAP